ncbi:MAG TPA: PHP domain-containing protein, partial [Phycisphaerales bacterium]|nr:PHP domain-containing protein [Phycisphaerales bacterium]
MNQDSDLGFVHLHLHSQFSLLDGTMPPEVIASQAAALGMKAAALTDTSNMFGAVAF